MFLNLTWLREAVVYLLRSRMLTLFIRPTKPPCSFLQYVHPTQSALVLFSSRWDSCCYSPQLVIITDNRSWPHSSARMHRSFPIRMARTVHHCSHLNASYNSVLLRNFSVSYTAAMSTRTTWTQPCLRPGMVASDFRHRLPWETKVKPRTRLHNQALSPS